MHSWQQWAVLKSRSPATSATSARGISAEGCVLNSDLAGAGFAGSCDVGGSCRAGEHARAELQPSQA